MHTISTRLQSMLDNVTGTVSAKTPDIIFAAFILAFFLIAAYVAPRITKSVLRPSKLPTEAVRVIESAVFFGLITIGILAALNELGISLGALGIEISILGLAAGFALKDVLTNLVSGLLILSSRPFVIGDEIRVKEFEGTVAAVGFRGTTLVTYDGRHVILPNIDLITNPLTNNTASPLRRHSITIGISLDSDLPFVKKLILDALDDMPDVAEVPRPDVLVSQIADFDIKLEICIWTAALQSEVKRINSEATQRVYAVLIANRVQIPLPTSVVNMRAISSNDN